MTPAVCPDCGRRFKTRPAAFRHWIGAHYRARLGAGERAVLDELEAMRRRRYQSDQEEGLET